MNTLLEIVGAELTDVSEIKSAGEARELLRDMRENAERFQLHGRTSDKFQNELYIASTQASRRKPVLNFSNDGREGRAKTKFRLMLKLHRKRCEERECEVCTLLSKAQ